ncbi:TonB-dependent receptor [Aquimarina sp. MMG015]|uniref:TonB-dependent receptor n=1 Tax=unclassified Aquimarina TaxID=2627091 RepID=UPI000E47E451|nr:MULTISPECIES: TonB-dependent receptor [unclassified Aquimarina]AXT56935.1 TonB-dependent receptor [Aquimarina sp. AD1]MBQ4801823.1 TonB-dependent receptor [Aquimarina sp. MMG015]RKN32127.1 TonB-dependent receptor [Aquimarina sp. AD1]
MRKFFTVIALFYLGLNFAQETGSIAGTLLDKEVNNQPLPFANIVIVGTTQGTSSDFDGKYEITNITPGTYTLEFSFTGYETLRIPDVVIEPNKVTVIDTALGATAAALEEVVIKVQTSREREEALLLEQKNAVQIKESIGAEQLTRLGVSNASAATTKISGVSKAEGSGDIYVRGLGDRYLSTTLNGLPIPSDNIDKKNIDLELFPTRFIGNVSISKTFAPSNSADLASGNIDIVSKQVTKTKDIGVSVSAGVNSNAADSDIFSNFKTTANNNDISLGIYSREFEANNLVNALTQQSWNTTESTAPINYGFGFNIGGILGEARNLKLYFSGGQSVDHEYREGLFREYDQGNLRDIVPEDDLRRWLRTVNSTAMLHSQYKISDDHKLSFNSFVINKVFEETLEAGRERTTEFFEELDNIEEGSQFLRDQNIKNTFLSATQLIGEHRLSEKNNLEWAAGFNYLVANEPNRIRNEVNILNDNPNTPENEDGIIELGFTGGFQQRKSVQEITDQEINARISDKWVLKQNEDEEDIFVLNVGGDFRNKTRDFLSQFFGVEEGNVEINPTSIDALGDIFTQQNFDTGALQLNTQPIDTYDAELLSYSGNANFTGTFNKFTAQVGVRYQKDEIDVNFDVGNFVNPLTGQARIGSSNKEYDNFYPYLNLKYSVNEKLALRLSGSLGQTLPEFKEIAPFQYVSQVGQVFQGNPNVERSQNYNVDFKVEFFPENDELISFSAFYKRIEDPINRGLQRGGEDIFSYFNTGDRARILGFELEGRVYIIKKRESNPNLRLSGNISYLDHVQDLKDVIREDGTLEQTFKYGNRTEIGLEGASDWISNLSLTFNSGEEFPYELTLTGNYTSDKIFALGAPRNQQQPDVFFNGEIIEKGFVTLDFIANKQINDNWSIGLTAKNLLNPTIERTQFIQEVVSGDQFEDTILSYSTGVNTSLSVSYKF